MIIKEGDRVRWLHDGEPVQITVTANLVEALRLGATLPKDTKLLVEHDGNYSWRAL